MLIAQLKVGMIVYPTPGQRGHEPTLGRRRILEIRDKVEETFQGIEYVTVKCLNLEIDRIEYWPSTRLALAP